VFADSGAFSAYAQGESVDVYAYAEWLHKNKKFFEVYANLDVKGDVEKGLRNQEILEGEGLSPIPVFHMGEPWDVFEDMCNRYEYIALGGVAGGSVRGQTLTGWLAQCFEIAMDKARLHGFGMTDYKLVATFPFYSVDSKSWGQGFQYANVPMYDPGAALKHADLLDRYGIDPLVLADREKYDYDQVAGVGAMAYMLFENWINNRHQKSPWKWFRHRQRIHLVDTNMHHFRSAGRWIKEANQRNGQ
jgi:hypothetical protein